VISDDAAVYAISRRHKSAGRSVRKAIKLTLQIPTSQSIVSSPIAC